MSYFGILLQNEYMYGEKGLQDLFSLLQIVDFISEAQFLFHGGAI